MADPTRRRVRYAQLETLWEFLQKNRELALGYNKTIQAREYSRRMWREIADQLNSYGDGAIKDWKGWCKYWNDYKSKLKKMAVAARTSHRQTGGGPSGVKPLTDLEKKFLDFLGPDFGVGLPGMRVEPFAEEVLEVPGVIIPSASASEGESLSLLQPYTEELSRMMAPLPQATQRGHFTISTSSGVATLPPPPAASPPLHAQVIPLLHAQTTPPLQAQFTPPLPAQTTPPLPAQTTSPLPAQPTPRRSPRRRRLRRDPPMSQDAGRRALMGIAEERNNIARHLNTLVGSLINELRVLQDILRSRPNENPADGE